jgi:phage-related protein (TIGR01555 family)
MAVEKSSALARVIRLTKDGWSNLITGLNSQVAKKKHTTHRADSLITDEELESIYIEDGLGKRIVNLLPSDMFREGWEYSFPDMEDVKAKELAEKYSEVMELIEAPQKCKEALQWARLKGGSAILIGALDGRTMDQPLEPKKIKPNGFEKLRVLDRSEIEFDKIQFQMDPTKPRYGLPELYPIKFDISAVQQDTKMVHYTRVIDFHGDRLPGKTKQRVTADVRFWGFSVLQGVDDKLRTVGSSIGSIDQLLHEMSVGKFKIKELANLLSTPEGKEAIQRRVELMDLTRSVFRSQYLDADGEDFSRDNVSFQGVPEILYILFMLISASTGYPITRLFGVSPGGMNATGESDMRNYYDAVRSEQELLLQPVLLRLVRIIAEWQKIEEPYIEFIPLETMNEKERAEVEKIKADTEQVKAQTYRTYIDAGIMEPYMARFLEFGDTLDKIPVPEEDMLPEVKTIEEPEQEPMETPDEDDAGNPDTKKVEDKDKPQPPPPPKPKAKKKGKTEK